MSNTGKLIEIQQNLLKIIPLKFILKQIWSYNIKKNKTFK